MSDSVIRVHNLGKQYRLGQTVGYKTLRESLTDGVRSIFGGKRDQKAEDQSNDFWALKDVSFEVKQGEVVGIIGRNGAGKSTLLKILSQITEPTEGYVELDGRVGSLLEVGTGFHPELSGKENIYLNGAILGMTRAEVARKFDEIVAFSEVEKFLDTPVKRYSSGMYTRLAFAVAAHLDPEILIVDEVLAVGDAEFQKKCLGKMKDVAGHGRTVLFVSHNMGAIEEMCSTAMLLERGRLVATSTDVRTLTVRYLFGESGSESVCTWVNSGKEHRNPYFCPLRAWIGDEHGEVLSMPARNDAEIWLFIDGKVEICDPAFNIGYAIISDSGHQLYWSFSTDTAESEWPQLAVGNVRVKVRIPSRLLNAGDYRVDVLASLHNRQWIFEMGRGPSLQLSIQGGLSDSPYWLSRRAGLLAPVLRWHHEPTERPFNGLETIAPSEKGSV